VSARKIGFLILILVFGGVVELAWHIREDHFAFGPEGIRVLGGRFYGPSFTFEESAERAVAEGEPLEVDVRNAFGGVQVVPGDGATVQVRLRKVVYQPTEKKARAFADRVELRLEEEEGRLRVGTNRDDVGRDENVGFETHLELQVPPEATAVIRSDHGAVDARGIAGADVHASFDEVHVRDIVGPVTIDARHGAVEAVDLGAELTLTARHGDVEVSGVEGHCEIDVQHGKLQTRRTAGVDAKVSYGALVAEEVEGDLLVEARHAEARVADVAGGADVQTSYADIRLEGIGGDARARVEHGGVHAVDVTGTLTAEASHQDVSLDRVRGRVEVSVRGGGVAAQGLGDGVHARTRGGDVSIDGFRGPVDVEADGGNVRLVPGAPLVEAIVAAVRDGEVRLEVPPGSRFTLEAESRHGELEIDVPELDRRRTEGRVTGTIGGGGASVSLTADGDVTLAPGSTTLPAEQPE
jgi:DUF4097 and DUF4098 domain-containing protein YvlB